MPPKKKPKPKDARSNLTEWERNAKRLWRLAIKLNDERTDETRYAIDVALAVCAYLAGGDAGYFDGHSRRDFQRDPQTREAIERAWAALYGRSTERATVARRKLADKIETAQRILHEGLTKFPDEYVRRLRQRMVDDLDPKFAKLDLRKMLDSLSKSVKAESVMAEWLAVTDALDANGRTKDELRQTVRDTWGRARPRLTAAGAKRKARPRA